MPSPTELIQAAAARMQGITISINHSLPSVCISDDSREHDDIFMQGDEAQQFIDACEWAWNETGDTTIEACQLCEAEQYVKNLWN